MRGSQPPLLALPRRKVTHCAGEVSAALQTCYPTGKRAFQLAILCLSQFLK
jgi:hypothetical protein